MKYICFAFILYMMYACQEKASQAAGPVAKEGIRIVKTGLNHPWEILWSKDNHIWMTERDGKVSCIDPVSGNTVFSYIIDEVEPMGEGGLLGMALDPGFAQNRFLYVVYNYRHNGDYREKLVRYTYTGQTLSQPLVLLDGIRGGSIHDGSRLWIIEGAAPKIFMSTGDASHEELAQQTNTLNGKILRINTDGSIPTDNPFAGNPVWSYGHRNIQGLVMVNNIMYASEHGPTIEDELNIIEKARNYGWPEVTGPCNGSELPFCDSHRVKEPVWSSGGGTLAVCGLDYYNNALIPQWKNSLLMMTLKNSSIRQLGLSTDGRSVTTTRTWFANEWGRLRDVCIAANGKVYVCTSNGGGKDVIIEISKL